MHILLDRIRKALFILPALVLLWLAIPSSAQAATVPIEIAIDVSGSMGAKLEGETRMTIAKRTVKETTDGLDAVLALRAFGHNYSNSLADKPKSCLDTELLVDFGGTPAQVNAAVDGLEPSGWTPLAYTIQQAGKDLLQINKEFPNQKAVLIVLSDGQDSCDGDPVAEAKALVTQGIDFVAHVIGFAVDAQTKANLESLATATGGKYFSADSAAELKQSFEKIVEVEEVEAKEAADVIQTTGAENTVVGGSTFDDAKSFPRKLLGKEFSLIKHLLPGAFETFTLEVEAGQKLDINILTGEKGIIEVDGAVETSTKYGTWSKISFYTNRKVAIDAVRTSTARFSELNDSVLFKNGGTVFFFIGHDTSSNYGIPQDTRYTLTLKNPDGSVVGATAEIQEKDTDDTAQKPITADKEQKEPIVSTKSSGNRPLGKILPVIGVGALALIGVTVATIFALKRKKKKTE